MFVRAADLDPAERRLHEACMARALDAAANADAPYAAVATLRGAETVLCVGRNRHRSNPILHGEIDALLSGGRADPPVDWRSAALYCTGEPCPMCMSAAIWAGIPEVVFATSIATLDRLGAPQIRIDAAETARAAPFHRCRIVGGVLEDRADALFAAWIAARETAEDP